MHAEKQDYVMVEFMSKRFVVHIPSAFHEGAAGKFSGEIVARFCHSLTYES